MSQVKSLRTGIKFKDTPIGKIPVDWEVRKLGDVANVRRGASPRPINDPKWFGGAVGWVRISDVSSSNKYLRKTKDYLSDEGVKHSVKIKKGEVILSICATIGRPIIVDMDACIHDGFVWFEGLKEDIEREFFYYFFENKEKDFASRRQTGTQGNLNTSIISSAYIPLPPFPEQKKIADILTNVDDAIEETDRIIEKTRELKKGLMQKLLTRGIGHKKFKKTEIGEIPAEWEVGRVADFGEIVTGSTPGTAVKEYYGNDFPFVSPFDLGKVKVITKTEKYLSKEGASVARMLPVNTILFVCIGSTIGKIGIAGVELATNQQLNSIICKTNDFNFVYYYLDFIRDKIKQMAGTQAVPIVNKSLFSNITVAIPELKEQKEIGKILSSVDEDIEESELHRQTLETLKKSLMQVLLTGRVRVKLQ